MSGKSGTGLSHASGVSLKLSTFLANPASRARLAPRRRSSALSLTDPNRTYHSKFQSRAEAPRLICV